MLLAMIKELMLEKIELPGVKHGHIPLIKRINHAS
jgi:hypothetical protein